MKKICTTFSILCILSQLVCAKVVCKESSDYIVIQRNGLHVLTYNKTAKVPAGVDKKYERNGFIHPITTPSGRVITDGYPLPHHSHQNGMFFAWRKATFEGKSLNFWEPTAAKIRHEKVIKIMNEKDHAGFQVELSHADGTQKILREIWTVTVSLKTGHIDLKSEQTCATDSPLTLDRYHYGGMAIRGSRQWFPSAHTSAGKGAVKDEFVEPCTMITSEGLNQEDGNHSRPKWVCMSGKIDSASVAITLIPHPSNFRYPQHVRLHPKMPYFCFIPTVEKPFKIEPGKPWLSRYRIVIQDDTPKPEMLDKIQQAYAAEE